MTEIACAITGHRPKSFPWKYNETAPDCVLLKETLAAQIKLLADSGVTDWLSGMALGVDLWCAQIVLSLKEKNPALRLHCILPCEGQEVKWPKAEQEQYHSILKRADEVVYVSRDYHPDCMLERNRYMVDRASILLAVYNGTYRSGTAMTVRYAKEQGTKIMIIDPISRVISSMGGDTRNGLLAVCWLRLSSP